MELTTFEWITATLVGVLSVARTARLLIHDDFPPSAWLRKQWFVHVDNDWADLFRCQFCMAPYLAAGMMGWAYLSDLHWTWWAINGWWAASYLAAIVVSYDQRDE